MQRFHLKYLKLIVKNIIRKIVFAKVYTPFKMSLANTLWKILLRQLQHADALVAFYKLYVGTADSFSHSLW
jgi:hypothetical protein